MSQDRRAAPRLRGANLVSYTEVDEQELVRKLGLGATLDVSVGGMKIWSTEPLPLAATIHFELALENRVIHVNGRVVYAQEEADERYLMGIKFVGITEVDQELLRQYLTTGGSMDD